ncbi:MAG TPA: glycerophosphoryl diester phosphodiesterase membrane domain-containing protein [Angustibacter sp.]|nr:glycerophosphoryl diester phosphodiesterase membrane domain-containing protein [Angustibacter sp.]
MAVISRRPAPTRRRTDGPTWVEGEQMSEPPAWQPPGSATPEPSPPVTSSPPAAAPSGWGQPPAWGQPTTAWGPAQGYLPPPEPPRPGVVPLRPLGLGEILDGAVQTMRHNPRVMFGLSALVAGVAALVSSVLLLVGVPQLLAAADLADTASSGGSVDTSQVASAVGGSVVTLLVPAALQSLALAVLNGILIIAVSDAVIGRRPTAGDVLRRVRWSGVGRLLLLTVVTFALSVAVVAVVAVPVALLYVVAVPAGVVATLVGLPLLVVVGVVLFTKLAFAAPSLLLEELGVVAALRRSWRLVTGSFWRVFGILLLSAAIAWAASSLLQLPFSLLGQLAGLAAAGADPSETTQFVVATLIGNLGSVLGSAVVAPFTAGVTSLLYIDLRIRREGLDVALARAASAA